MENRGAWKVSGIRKGNGAGWFVYLMIALNKERAIEMSIERYGKLEMDITAEYLGAVTEIDS